VAADWQKAGVSITVAGKNQLELQIPGLLFINYGTLKAARSRCSSISEYIILRIGLSMDQLAQ